MKFPRRQFMHLAAAAAVLPAISRIARAQAYPTKPVRVIVGAAPAGGTDIIARLIGQRLAERLGQPFTIENRGGAASNIATEAVVRARADGYTLLMTDASPAINATLYDKLSFVFLRDVAPIACIMRTPQIVVVNPMVPVKGVPEFIAYVRANPGRINMASAGNGTPSHLQGELFKTLTGIAMTHVPYRGGGPAVADLIGGQVQVYFSGVATAIEYIRAGRLRALGVTTATRWEGLPDMPAIAEFVPEYDLSQWYGLSAPKQTPVEIVDRLNREINGALAEPAMQARIAEQGGTTVGGSPADFAKLIADDTTKWAKVVKLSGARPE
jgi:tripartite-type tricarboxylate transporter receptor subunit TctC